MVKVMLPFKCRFQILYVMVILSYRYTGFFKQVMAGFPCFMIYGTKKNLTLIFLDSEEKVRNVCSELDILPKLNLLCKFSKSVHDYPTPPPPTTPAYLRVLVPSSYRKDEWTLTRGKHTIFGSNDVTNSWSPYWKTLFITTRMSCMMLGQWTLPRGKHNCLLEWRHFCKILLISTKMSCIIIGHCVYYISTQI
jgi:hypothetical protein